MVESLDVVKLTRDIPQHGLLAGAQGTALDPIDEGRQWLVEFVGPDGCPLTEDPVPALPLDALEVVWTPVRKI